MGILTSVEFIESLPESLTQGLLIGKLLIGGLGVRGKKTPAEKSLGRRRSQSTDLGVGEQTNNTHNNSNNNNNNDNTINDNASNDNINNDTATANCRRLAGRGLP